MEDRDLNPERLNFQSRKHQVESVEQHDDWQYFLNTLSLNPHLMHSIKHHMYFYLTT